MDLNFITLEIMNIYNTLYLIEYVRSPCLNIYGYKQWYLNLSKNKYHYKHRDFDLCSHFSKYCKEWSQYDRYHRLIGPAIVDHFVFFKRCIIRGKDYIIKNDYYIDINET